MIIIANIAHLIQPLEEIKGRFAVINIHSILDLVGFGEVVRRDCLLHIDGSFLGR